jgi:hypothetical protein
VATYKQQPFLTVCAAGRFHDNGLRLRDTLNANKLRLKQQYKFGGDGPHAYVAVTELGRNGEGFVKGKASRLLGDGREYRSTDTATYLFSRIHISNKLWFQPLVTWPEPSLELKGVPRWLPWPSRSDGQQ